jgi:hypothetical protein
MNNKIDMNSILVRESTSFIFTKINTILYMQLQMELQLTTNMEIIELDSQIKDICNEPKR